MKTLFVLALALCATSALALNISGEVGANATVGDTVYCYACQKVVSLVETQGCSALPTLCNSLGSPGSSICNFIVSSGLCNTIVGWINNNYPPDVICTKIGLCGSTCSCGTCTAAVYSQRCLSLPNNCPAPTAAPLAAEGASFRPKH